MGSAAQGKALAMARRQWAEHFHQRRPPGDLGPGIPDPTLVLPLKWPSDRHKVPDKFRVGAVLGLHITSISSA